MKYLRNALAALALLAVTALALLWFLPARWALPWVEPQLRGMHLQQVQGSVWNGAAGAVIGIDGQRLGRLHWQVSRRALLGDLQLHAAFDGPQLTFSGAVRRLPDGRLEADDVHLQVALDPLQARLPSPFGRPLGELQVTVEHVVLQGGWPLQLQAHGLWQRAAMQTAAGELALGDIQLAAQAQAGVIQAQWHDLGNAPLQVNGQLQLSPLGWRLDTTLRARQTDPALQRWLAGLGPVSADGSVHIQQSGGLAGSPPSPHQGGVQP